MRRNYKQKDKQVGVNEYLQRTRVRCSLRVPLGFTTFMPCFYKPRSHRETERYQKKIRRRTEHKFASPGFTLPELGYLRPATKRQPLRQESSVDTGHPVYLSAQAQDRGQNTSEVINNTIQKYAKYNWR